MHASFWNQISELESIIAPVSVMCVMGLTNVVGWLAALINIVYEWHCLWHQCVHHDSKKHQCRLFVITELNYYYLNLIHNFYSSFTSYLLQVRTK